MGDPRGLSVNERYSYEYSLLRHLNVMLPDNPQTTRLSIYGSQKDALRDRRCEDAAEMIHGILGTTSMSELVMNDSNRGRNHYDYILHSSKNPDPFILEVRVSKPDYYGLRIQYWTLLDILMDKLSAHEQDLLRHEAAELKRILDENTGLFWSSLPDKRSMVYAPARRVLAGASSFLQLHGSGLLPCLWDYFYGMPILRCKFLKEDTDIQYIAPIRMFKPEESIVFDNPSSIGVIEKSSGGSVKTRIHNSSKKISTASLLVDVNFSLPDELYTYASIHYAYGGCIKEYIDPPLSHCLTPWL